MMKREVARRVFAKELNNSTHVIRSGGEKAPVYLLTPLGLRCNRVFVVGALLEKEETKPESGIWRIRVSDPTGSFVGYIGKFQPEALEMLLDIDYPSIVSLTAKVKVLEGIKKKFVILRPEMINTADPDVRDRWIIEAAKCTIERIKDVELGKTEDAKIAKEIYKTDLEDYKRTVKDVLMKLKEEFELLEEVEEEELELEIEEEEFDIKDLFE
ncbi:MAG: hypothetical protein NZ895_02755 [Archaeoglobaceae archaeon]|nr:hypothetical protein [Archaeoglobaceae archaeon]MCX8151839.1 hypothetical protein [Archaeoglobaceae archaeon]MDW8014329.1 hypothetical protein [Archaeoglobaceae archaeon]